MQMNKLMFIKNINFLGRRAANIAYFKFKEELLINIKSL